MEQDTFRLKEIKPAISGYLRDAQVMLRRDPFPGDDVIHDVRVLMKKSRSGLKLAADHLDKEFVRKDILAQREVGRKMCAWRENSVLRKNLKELKKDFPAIFSMLADNEKINLMMKRPDRVKEPTENMKAELGEIMELLRKSGFRIRFLSMNKIDPHMLIRDLELNYRKVADKFLICRNNPKPVKIHEFRKKAKDLLYQLYFFRPMNPGAIKSLEKKLDIITRNLGRYNDLNQLLGELEYKYSAGKNQPALDELVLRIREKQDRHLSKVWTASYKIFCPAQNLLKILGIKMSGI
jgi:CHAD domain-containing protein